MYNAQINNLYKNAIIVKIIRVFFLQNGGKRLNKEWSIPEKLAEIRERNIFRI